ncbi:hypothetical protein DM01DRAFT_1339411 [Hesseltinella vesiculosa]|uniref:Mtf2-like C-terminal domain-containing protein n=1 Tax=Hesseltinella vesiculosa TaxID=101127 RepID=A0A1X2G703_9FUNG|nr:hypothetical protein DM01DRAFT_1339411 [Hesseltinella vesiculosa]
MLSLTKLSVRVKGRFCTCQPVIQRQWLSTNGDSSNRSINDDQDHPSKDKYSIHDSKNDQPAIEFWDLPEDKRHSVKQRAQEQSINFQKLLDQVIATGRKSTASTKPVTKDSTRMQGQTASAIEQRLLEMVRRNKVYKEKAPLPRSMMPAMYGKLPTSPTLSQSLDPYDRLGRATEDSPMKSRDQQVKLIDELLSTTSSTQLLSLLTKTLATYQEQQMYPSYYSRLVTNAIQHAYVHFADPYLAIALFDQCKSLSPLSYIQGCTVDVYNHVLHIRWEAWRDIYGMLELMEEMTLNGIQFNEKSLALVRTVASEMDQQVLSQPDNPAGFDTPWSPEDVRSIQLMKTLVGKWSFK